MADGLSRDLCVLAAVPLSSTLPTSASPGAAAQLANPAGIIQGFCMANGLYKITARQLGLPYRPGQIQVTTPDGCESFAQSDGLYLTGSPSEAAPAGLSLYFAVGLDPRQQIGELYTGQCNPQIDMASATRGWAGCVAAGGTRVLVTFAGGSVWHASDVSWRVAAGSGIPTNMSGPTASAYQPLANSQPEQWCMQSAAGPFTLFAFDNNVLSAANNSQGWDGGALLVLIYQHTDLLRCVRLAQAPATKRLRIQAANPTPR